MTVYREMINIELDRRSLTGDPEVYAEFKADNVEDILSHTLMV